MGYKEEIEKTLVELREALERGRAIVMGSNAEDEEKNRLLNYIQGFDDKFIKLERQLVDVYMLFVEKNELIDVCRDKLMEAYDEIARLKVDNRGLEDSLFCDIKDDNKQSEV